MQLKIEDVVGQYDPAGQALAAVDLARQMFPDAHTVAADTPDPQYDPGGHWV